MGLPNDKDHDERSTICSDCSRYNEQIEFWLTQMYKFPVDSWDYEVAKDKHAHYKSKRRQLQCRLCPRN